MKKYLFITIGSKNIRVELDNEMQRKLKRTLKDNYQYDDKGCLKTNFEDKETTYKTKQIVFKNLLDQISEYDLPPELKSRVETLKSSINLKKSTIYSSDLTELERLFKETTQMYDNLKKSNTPKKGEGTKTEELKEKITNSLTSTDAESNLEVAIAALDEASKDKVMGPYLSSEKVDEAIENIVICETKEEYERLTNSSNETPSSKNEVTIETITQSLDPSSESKKTIFLPPDASTEDIVRSIVSSNYIKDEKGIEVEIPGLSPTRNKAYSATLNSLLTDMVTNFTLKGINSRNISYYGLNFIKEYMKICEGNGADFERLLKGYFRGEKNAISLFIKDIIRYNGGDASLRYLMESMLVEQAVNKKLISRDYLKKIQKPEATQELLNKINAGQKEDLMNLNLHTRFGGVGPSDLTKSTLNAELQNQAINNKTSTTNVSSTLTENHSGTLETHDTTSTTNDTTNELNSTTSHETSLINDANLNIDTNYIDHAEASKNVNINIPTPPSVTAGLPPYEMHQNAASEHTMVDSDRAFSGTNALDLDNIPNPEISKEPEVTTNTNQKIIPFPTKNRLLRHFTSTTTTEGKIIDFNNYLKNNGKKNNNLNTSRIAYEEEEAASFTTDEQTEEEEEQQVSPSSAPNSNENSETAENRPLENIKAEAEDAAKEVLMEEAKKKAKAGILAFIKKNPYVIAIAAGVILLLIIILVLIAVSGNEETLNPDFVYNGTFNNGSYWWPVGSSAPDESGLYSGDPVSVKITSYFGPRNAPTAGASSNHGAIDIGGVGRDTPVIATAGGTVIKVVKGCSEGNRRCGGGFGNYVMIDHGNGLTSLYGHLSSVSVTTNDTVTQGQKIGITGSTGVSTGPHLHFELRLNGTKVDPLNYVSATDTRPKGSYSLDTGDIDVNFINFLHSWEGTGPGATDTTYTVYADPGGVLTVGYGVTLKYNPDLFRARGIDPNKIKKGDKINRQLVDSIELEIVAGKLNSVKNTTSKCVNLNDKQIYALVSRMYNTGNISSFCANYDKYKLTEQLYTNYMSKPITQKGTVLKGLIRRREAEWDLFYKGIYHNNG